MTERDQSTIDAVLGIVTRAVDGPGFGVFHGTAGADAAADRP
jgi:hypothetical protein